MINKEITLFLRRILLLSKKRMRVIFTNAKILHSSHNPLGKRKLKLFLYRDSNDSLQMFP